MAFQREFGRPGNPDYEVYLALRVVLAVLGLAILLMALTGPLVALVAVSVLYVIYRRPC